MLIPRSSWKDVRSASSVPTMPNPGVRPAVQDALALQAKHPEHAADADQAGQDAIEGRNTGKPNSHRRAIGIMFGIDPRNLYEAPGEAQSRDQAVRDLD